MLRYSKIKHPFIGLNLITIIILINLLTTKLILAKPYKSHRCLDWRFGGWSPLYNLQPNVSPPIYHQLKQPTSEIYHIQHYKQPISANLNNYQIQTHPQQQAWLPYQNNKEQAKVIRYNVRKPPSSKYSKYPHYPQYLPTTVLHLKPATTKKPQPNYQKLNYQPNNKLNVYSVPLNIKNLYSNSEPRPNLIYEQLNYQLSNHHINKYPNGYSIHTTIPSNQKLHNQYPISRPINRPPKQNKPKKKTIAAYIPVVQVPAIEQVQNYPQYPKVKLPNLDLKKPISNYEEKVIEEHIYQIPNHMLHEIRHEIKSNNKNIYPMPAPISDYQPPIIPHIRPLLPKNKPNKMPYIQHLQPISQPISHVHQAFGSHANSYTNIEIGKPQISYEIAPAIETPQYNTNENYGNEKQLEGPSVYGNLAYQMENYAKPEDSGLFKPLLDQTRKENNYPKIGVIPYKHNDPENLNVIHLIANQKHLPMVVPITSIHTSNDGSYPVAHNEYPAVEKVISSYSERPIDYVKQQEYTVTNENYVEKIEQQKANYVEDEKMILQQLHSPNVPKNTENYKEQPQYVIHQTYSPISSLPDIPPPPVPEIEHQQQVNKNQEIKGNDYNVQQEVKSYQPAQQQQEINSYQPVQQQQEINSYQPVQQQQEINSYQPVQQQQEIKTDYQPVQQQQEINSYQPVQIEQIQQKEQINEKPIQQIQQITTEYVKKDEPMQTPDTYTQIDHQQAPQEYGRRVPSTNYQYIKPNIAQTTNNYDQASNGQQSNEQVYTQQQQVESQKTVQHESSGLIKDDEQANIAAYEEARKSILQPLSYTSSSVYQQSSYQPPLTAYDQLKDSKVNDYSDDYSSYENSNSNNYNSENNGDTKTSAAVRIEEEIKNDQNEKVYDLASNTDKVNYPPNNSYLGKSEILTSEEQTKKDYEVLPQKTTSVNVESKEEPIKIKSESILDTSKYGERLVYVKSKKFKNLRMVDGNTYLGDTLLYSASSRSSTNSGTNNQQTRSSSSRSFTSTRAKRIKDSKPINRGTVTAITSTLGGSEPIKSIDSKEINDQNVELTKLTESNLNVTNQSFQNLTLPLIDELNTTLTINNNKTEEDNDKIVNYVKPISRSALRNLRIRKLISNKSDGKLDELITSASELIESKIKAADVFETDSDDLKADDSQLFHAYYGYKDQEPKPGYVRLTIQQFRELFKDAEIHVLDQDLQSSTATPLNDSALNDKFSSSTISSTAQI